MADAEVRAARPTDTGGYGFPVDSGGPRPNRPPGVRRSAVAQPAARALADVGVRLGAAGHAADRHHHRAAVLHRLRPAVRAGHPGDVGWLKLPTFDWPTDPSWLYRLNQGLHVGLGLILIPVVLAKLWSVIPRLFSWPPARSIAQVLERVSLLMLVGGILFEIITGVLNIQYDYIFGFSFYTAHYYGAWVFIAGFVIHIAIKIPRMWSGLRSMSMREVLRTNRADTRPGAVRSRRAGRRRTPRRRRSAAAARSRWSAAARCSWPSSRPGRPLGGCTRQTALLLPRGRSRGDGPNDFQVNSTACGRGDHRRSRPATDGGSP